MTHRKSKPEEPGTGEGYVNAPVALAVIIQYLNESQEKKPDDITAQLLQLLKTTADQPVKEQGQTVGALVTLGSVLAGVMDGTRHGGVARYCGECLQSTMTFLLDNWTDGFEMAAEAMPKPGTKLS